MMNEGLNVAHVVPGSGGKFYCQNCLRDLALVPALRELGHDAYVLPLYLPLSEEMPESLKDAKVFYGAVNLYLSEKFPILKLLPAVVRRWLDSKRMLKFAAGHSGSTKARGLESMTISVLKGMNGSQSEVLKELVSWIKLQPTIPDVIHLSNALLLGMAPTLKEEFDVPIVCSLQDELGWINTMAPKFIDEVWRLMQNAATYVDDFVGVSEYYANEMTERLKINSNKMTVIPVGISLKGLFPPETKPKIPTIGFLSKNSAQYGFDVIVDAFMRLKNEPKYANLKFKATGGMTPDVRPLLKVIEKKLRAANFWDDVELLDDFSDEKRGDFLRDLTILSVPVPNGEAFGTYLIEAMACGVPVVQPRVGAFVEVVENTGGGILYSPTEPTGLVDALRSLLDSPETAAELGATGKDAVHARYGIDTMAKQVARLYEKRLSASRKHKAEIKS